MVGRVFGRVAGGVVGTVTGSVGGVDGGVVVCGGVVGCVIGSVSGGREGGSVCVVVVTSGTVEVWGGTNSDGKAAETEMLASMGRLLLSRVGKSSMTASRRIMFLIRFSIGFPRFSISPTIISADMRNVNQMAGEKH